MLNRCLKFALHLTLAVGFSSAVAGAYEDFFKALVFDDARTVDGLLARGFDPNARDEKGQPALVVSLREGSFKTAALLLGQAQLQPDLANPVGETALMMAALKGQTDWVRKLLDRGARPDPAEPKAWSALHYAASGPEPQTLALLLARGARIDARSPNGSTPLMMAARYGSEDAVRLLLDKGADPRLRNDLGLGAADFARDGGRQPLSDSLQRAAR